MENKKALFHVSQKCTVKREVACFVTAKTMTMEKQIPVISQMAKRSKQPAFGDKHRRSLSFQHEDPLVLRLAHTETPMPYLYDTALCVQSPIRKFCYNMSKRKSTLQAYSTPNIPYLLWILIDMSIHGAIALPWQGLDSSQHLAIEARCTFPL